MRWLVLGALLAACGGSNQLAASPEREQSCGGVVEPKPTPGSFEDDLHFLQQRGSVIVLSAPRENGRVAISPTYQARVMTSAVSAGGRSLGWINRSFIEERKTGTPFDNYGGEDRFWLGPEGGQYGLFFPPGSAFVFDAWQTPHALQEGEWTVARRAPDEATFTRSITVKNWSRFERTVDVERAIRLLSREAARVLLDVEVKDDLELVAFESVNRITNPTKDVWLPETGLLSIWVLAMFAPAADARVLIPFEKGSGEIVNDRYFGKVPASRLTVDAERGLLVFTADGKERGKIGLGPKRAKSVLGSYSAASKLLTVVQYDGPKRDARYVNSMWEKQKDPYAGDVVNSYNDGPPAPGKPPLGGFYELETSSPAAELAPGKDIVHTHRTFHFVGEPAVLDPIAQKLFGVRVSEIN